MIVETPGEKSDPTTYSRDDKPPSMEEAEAPRERERTRRSEREEMVRPVCTPIGDKCMYSSSSMLPEDDVARSRRKRD